MVRTLRWSARKAVDALGLEMELLHSPGLSARQRVGLSVRRYAAVATNARTVRFPDREFVYDSRLMPVLLPAYLTDVDRVARLCVVPEPALLLDIGANVGQFARTFLWRFPSARVWSFEPNTTVMPLLRTNAASHPQWAAVPCGLGPEDSDATLWSVRGKSGQGSLFRANAELDLRVHRAEAMTVRIGPLTPARRVELGIPPLVDVIKVDVEGAEESALRGLAAVAWRYMLIEVSHARAGGLTLDETLTVAKELWGVQPEVVWYSEPAAGARTGEAILKSRHADAAP